MGLNRCNPEILTFLKGDSKFSEWLFSLANVEKLDLSQLVGKTIKKVKIVQTQKSEQVYTAISGESSGVQKENYVILETDDGLVFRIALKTT